MLKRIRKMSKQKATGKEQEELAKSKDKGESKASSKEQEEQAKSKNKTGNIKEETDLTGLQSERDSLLAEVKNLKEQLEAENNRYSELKSRKTQQVCALTFKLAKAIRDKERAVEESEGLKQELQDLRNTRQQREEKHLDIQPDHVTLAVVEAREGPVLPEKEEDSDKMTSLVVNGEPKHEVKEEVWERENQDLVEKAGSGGEPSDAADDRSDCSSDTLSLRQSSFKSDDQNAKKKVIVEFRRIQKELRDVKKNMSMVQSLNERLSRDLQSLVDKKNSHPLVRSQSLRMRRNGSSDFPDDAVDGKRENVFVFPDAKTTQKEQEKTMQDVSTETEGCNVEQNDASDKKREVQDERIECSNQESLENTPHGLPVEFESAAHGEIKSPTDEMERQANVMEVRKQLQKAMKELEELREDNREMKEKINKIASSTDHGDFLRKTTQFTSALLKEMREREHRVERNMSKTLPKVHQPPLSVLGTRLNEITKTVDDMTKPEPIPTPLESVCVSSSVDPPLMSEPVPRPQSAGLPTTHTIVRQGNAEARSHTEQKKRRFTTGKLGEPSLAHRNVVRLTKDGGLTRSLEPLAKEWRSTESLSPRSSFSGSLGYRDYIQRHIVMSSNAIAKIRDLTPEELNGQIIY